MTYLHDLYAANVIRTYSGILFNFKDPVVEKVFAIDIAVALARECRFGGGTKKFYSVAEHSMWCAKEARERFAHLPYLPFKALLHDAHEAYLKDIPSPVKSHFSMEYAALAGPVQQAIHVRFGVTVSEEERTALYELDRIALEWEWENKCKKWTGLSFPHEDSRIELWLHTFKELCKVPYVVSPKENVMS